MNSMTKTILAALAILGAVLFYLSYFVVDQKHNALVLRFGDINRVVQEPGLYFKLPFADTVTKISAGRSLSRSASAVGRLICNSE